jgi:hypothetical protein
MSETNPRCTLGEPTWVKAVQASAKVIREAADGNNRMVSGFFYNDLINGSKSAG